MRRVYDKSVKGYVYHLSGGPGHKLALPKDAAKSPGLGLTQPFVVFQVFVPEGHHASFEIQFSDERGTRRRLLMSTSFVETKPSPLHCQVPLPPSALPPERWTQLAVHVPSMARALFSDNAASQGAAGFRAVEHVGVGAHCRLRRVFTLRDAPEGDEAFFDAMETIATSARVEESPIVAKPTPRAVDFPKDTPHKVSVVTPSRLSRFGQQSSRERGLSSRGEVARSRGASREGAPAPRGFFESPGSPHARGGTASRGVSRDGRSRRGSVDADGRPSRAALGATERWGFAALATSSGDGDVDAAPEGWQIAFGSRVSTPARGSRPSSRAKESASREQHSRGDRRANARPAGDGDRAFERDRLSANLARGLSFDDEKTNASRSLSKSQNFSTGEALGGALSDAPRAVSAAPSTRTKTATAKTAAPDFGGWDFMRDGVPTRGGGLFASPEKRESRKNETGQPVEPVREPVREPEPEPTHEYDARRYFPDDEAGDGVAFVDGDGTRSGDADSGGWGALRPKPMAGYGRGETPIPGRVDPGGDPSSLLERDYRMYTPELVVVSDRREGGGRSAGEKAEKAEKADREEADADAPSAGVGSGSAPRVSVSASSDSSTAEKENELAEELARVGVGPGLDPEKTKLAADRVADLDLVYDPILNFYYDPKNGKYYELA